MVMLVRNKEKAEGADHCQQPSSLWYDVCSAQAAPGAIAVAAASSVVLIESKLGFQRCTFTLERSVAPSSSISVSVFLGC